MSEYPKEIRFIAPKVENSKDPFEHISKQSLLMMTIGVQESEDLRSQINNAPEDSPASMYYVDTRTKNSIPGPLPETNQPYLVENNYLVDNDGTSTEAVSIVDEINGHFAIPPGSIDASGSKQAVKFFNNINTTTFSSMYKYLRASLIFRDTSGKVKGAPVPFQLGQEKKKNAEELKDMLNPRNSFEKGFGISVDSFTITADGQDPGLSKMLKAELTLKMPSGRYLSDITNNKVKMKNFTHESLTKDGQFELKLEDLFFHDKYAVRNELRTEILFEIGYTEPTFISTPAGLQTDRRQLDKLKYLNNSFYMVATEHSISLGEDGTITLNVTYHSSFDSELETSSRRKKKDQKKDSPPEESSSPFSEVIKDAYSDHQSKNPSIGLSHIESFREFLKVEEGKSNKKEQGKRATDIINTITAGNSNKFVIGYQHQLIKHQNSEKNKVYPRFNFSAPRIAQDSDNASNDSSEDNIHFVLMGEIIDFVYSKIAASESEMLIFGPVLIKIYDPVLEKTVERIYNIRNIPISLDLLQSVIDNSPIATSDDITDLQFHQILISGLYSKIASSTTASISILNSSGNPGQYIKGPTTGHPGFTALECMIPDSVISELNEDPYNNFLQKSQIKKIGKALSSNNSSVEDKSRVVYIGHIVPYSGSPGRESDYIFDVHGQRGVVKSLAFSPVEIDGLFESYLVNHLKGDQSTISDKKRIYRALQKVSVTTLGMPSLIPGLVIELNDPLLAINRGSAIANSIQRRYDILQVTTQISPSEFTTTIEAHPRIENTPISSTYDTWNQSGGITKSLNELFAREHELEPLVDSYVKSTKKRIKGEKTFLYNEMERYDIISDKYNFNPDLMPDESFVKQVKSAKEKIKEKTGGKSSSSPDEKEVNEFVAKADSFLEEFEAMDLESLKEEILNNFRTMIHN